MDKNTFLANEEFYACNPVNEKQTRLKWLLMQVRPSFALGRTLTFREQELEERRQLIEYTTELKASQAQMEALRARLQVRPSFALGRTLTFRGQVLKDKIVPIQVGVSQKRRRILEMRNDGEVADVFKRVRGEGNVPRSDGPIRSGGGGEGDTKN